MKFETAREFSSEDTSEKKLLSRNLIKKGARIGLIVAVVIVAALGLTALWDNLSGSPETPSVEELSDQKGNGPRIPTQDAANPSVNGQPEVQIQVIRELPEGTILALTGENLLWFFSAVGALALLGWLAWSLGYLGQTQKTPAEGGGERKPPLSLTMRLLSLTAITLMAVATLLWVLGNLEEPKNIFKLPVLVDADGVRIPANKLIPSFLEGVKENWWAWVVLGVVFVSLSGGVSHLRQQNNRGARWLFTSIIVLGFFVLMAYLPAHALFGPEGLERIRQHLAKEAEEMITKPPKPPLTPGEDGKPAKKVGVPIPTLAGYQGELWPGQEVVLNLMPEDTAYWRLPERGCVIGPLINREVNNRKVEATISDTMVEIKWADPEKVKNPFTFKMVKPGSKYQGEDGEETC